MAEPTTRFWELFLEVFEALPRQGPGDRSSAARALGMCRDLPSRPAVLDLGCGTGGQTLHLAELTTGAIVAVDRHIPNVVRLGGGLARRRLSHRVRPVVGDMARPSFPASCFDLIWSEGALYNIGIDRALRICRTLLRPAGYLAFTDAVWRRGDPPPEIRAAFDDYPNMGWASDLLVAIEAGGFEVVDHFTLPDRAWWDAFYAPMEMRLQELRHCYADDAEALVALDEIGREPELHRRYREYYAYEFFVARRTD
jgi:SAM-dependent methyltransferase